MLGEAIDNQNKKADINQTNGRGNKQSKHGDAPNVFVSTLPLLGELHLELVERVRRRGVDDMTNDENVNNHDNSSMISDQLGLPLDQYPSERAISAYWIKKPKFSVRYQRRERACDSLESTSEKTGQRVTSDERRDRK